MKVKTLSLLAGVSSLFVAGSAMADFLGVELLFSHNDPNGNDVWHLQAHFSAGGDGVLAVWGDPDSNAWFNVISGSINVTPGFDLIPSPPAFWDPNPHGTALTLSSGSFLGGGIPGVTAGGDFGLWTAGDVPEGNLTSNWTITDGAWFRLPISPNAQAEFDAGLGVWVQTLAQFNVTAEGVFEGVVNVTTLSGENHTNLYYAVPSPGALALLGVAGLFGVRRRRA